MPPCAARGSESSPSHPGPPTGWLVASHAAPDTPSSVHVARAPQDLSQAWQWQQLRLGADPLPGPVQETLDAITFQTLQVSRLAVHASEWQAVQLSQLALLVKATL